MNLLNLIKPIIWVSDFFVFFLKKICVSSGHHEEEGTYYLRFEEIVGALINELILHGSQI